MADDARDAPPSNDDERAAHTNVTADGDAGVAAGAAPGDWLLAAAEGTKPTKKRKTLAHTTLSSARTRFSISLSSPP